MTFLNQALAYGALASAIPLILHILNRSRFRTVQWGAMHLLESIIRVNHKRFQFDQLILLLVRCAIPVLLAVCLARPVLTGSRILEGNAPVSLVILLDTSYSMNAVDASESRYAKALDAACSILSSVGRGSQVAVIRTGGGPTPLFDQPLFEPEAVIRRLRQTRAGYGASDMPAALDQALVTLSGMTHARRRLIVISDFQTGDWDVSGKNSMESIRQRIRSMDIPPELIFLRTGSPVSGNISVDSLDVPRRALGVGQQAIVRAAIRNHGTSEIENARVVLRIDGVEASMSQMNLSAGGNTQALFPCAFEQPGSHVIEVEVITDDPLSDDNRLAAAVTIWDSIPVLLVDGDPGAQPLQSETDYLSIALTPFTFGRVRLSDLVAAQTIQPKDLTETLLQKSRVVVLANVAKLDAEQLSALTGYVESGGSLLVCAGNRLDLNWYRDRMFAEGTGLLPAAFGTPRGQIDGSGNSSRIVTQRYDHPALEFFNEPKNGDLSAAEIRRWYELLPVREGGSSTESVPSAEQHGNTSRESVILARLDNGDPFLIERRFGDGVVMQMATACDADWSDLPMRPFFVPLMQQLVTTLASQVSPGRNIVAGEPAVALFAADTDGTSDGTGSEVTLSIVTPDGSRRTVNAAPRGNLLLARFDGTQRPGVYTLTLPSAKPLHFVATTSRRESELDILDNSGLADLAESLDAEISESVSRYLEQDRLRRHGREIWKTVLAALLAFMFLELVLQQRFAGVRT